MKINSLVSAFLILSVLMPTGCREAVTEPESPGRTVITVGIPGDDVKTSIGSSQNGRRKVYWTDGDCLSLCGFSSGPLENVGNSCTVASFVFYNGFSEPYDLLYPAQYYKDENTITLPAGQDWASGDPAPVVIPMACRMSSLEEKATLNHLCTVLRLSVLLDSDFDSCILSSATFKGNGGEQLSGDFLIDYSEAVLTASGSDNAGFSLVSTVDQELSGSEPLDVYFVIPSGSYDSGFSVVLTDPEDRIMTLEYEKPIFFKPGRLLITSPVSFRPSVDNPDNPDPEEPEPIEVDPTGLELGLLEEEDLVITRYNVRGRVVDGGGDPVEEVVVSDGHICTRTMADGYFYMQSESDDVRFIFISTPSGYLPKMEKGVPKFYKAVSSLSRTDGILECGDFVINQVPNPDNCTILFTADPQPRSSGATYDKIAYHSLDCCNDLYRELRETAAVATSEGRQVYGVCLGDIVHENMSLFKNYVNNGLSTLGYPTFNVIGNHDYNTSAADDAAGAADYESWFGPVNYSFNIGKMHFVMLDNLIMYKDNGSLSSYYNGLDDTAWEWLKADLAMVPKSTVLMVCGHAPMFRKDTGAEVSSRASTFHGDDYAALLRSYKSVHAWAGHTHASFNYVYPSSHAYKGIQVHTLARSTGELWTNEYLSNGTPRGFTVVEVRGGVISSWRFHPTKYQSGAFVGSKKPDLKLCDWSYNSSGVAQWRGKDLDESYQMHVYPPGTYSNNYLYVNVFLYDGKWDMPVFIPNGSSPREMELVTSSERHDAADTEMKTFYNNNSILKNTDSYSSSTTGSIHTLFRVPASESGSGTVRVIDRFGNEYNQTISW